MVMPIVTMAQSTVSNGLQSSNLGSMFGNSGLVRSQSLSELIVYVIRIMLLFAGLVAVLFVIIGGYFYITAQGDTEQAEKGKNTLVNAIIGIVVVILSYVIVNVVSNLVGSNQI